MEQGVKEKAGKTQPQDGDRQRAEQLGVAEDFKKANCGKPEEWLALRKHHGQSAEDHHRGERGNERVHPRLGNQEPVDDAEQERGHQAAPSRQPNGKASSFEQKRRRTPVTA